MRTLLAIFGLLVGGAGILFWLLAAGAVQQAVAGLLVLIGTVMITGAAVLEGHIVAAAKLTQIHEELIEIRRALERK